MEGATCLCEVYYTLKKINWKREGVDWFERFVYKDICHLSIDGNIKNLDPYPIRY